jgi:ferredoxin
MVYTGAVKNLFGVIPGLTKAEYHLKMKSIENFAHHLIDICENVKPLYSVIDAIEGMEGDGPSAGRPRHAGLVMASASPYALDTAAAHVIGMDPLRVPTVRLAMERGAGGGDVKSLSIKGMALENIEIPPFRLPASCGESCLGGALPKCIENFALKTLRAKPVFNLALCISCGDCARGCPAGIIDMSSGNPMPDLGKCISCFCCHELCPEKAVAIKKHWLHRLLFRSG